MRFWREGIFVIKLTISVFNWCQTTGAQSLNALMKAWTSNSFTLKLIAAQNISAEARSSREDEGILKLKDLETSGRLWLFQKRDRLKWIFKKERRHFQPFFIAPPHQPNVQSSEGRVTLLPPGEGWLPPLHGASQRRYSLGPRSPVKSEPDGRHFRTALGECLLAAFVRLRLEPHGRHMQEMCCNNRMFITLGEGWQSRGWD